MGRQFADEIECVHCDAPIPIPLSTHKGREDHWLTDGQEFRCDDCGGVNVVAADEGDAYFIACDCRDCLACAKGGAL